MKTSVKIAASLAVVCCLATGCAKNPADETPSATVNTPAPAATATESTPAPAMEGTAYNFAEGAEVGFVGSKVTGSHSGGFKSVAGSVTVPGEDLEKAAIDIKIDMKSIFSDDEKLTQHLSGDDFFAIEKFPETTFKSTGVAKGEKGFTVTGDLTMHGVTKSISFPAEIAVEGDMLKTTAEFDINRKDFDIVYKGKPDDLIRDEVVIKFALTANKA